MTRAKNNADASFAKVRADHSTETAEDYVEGISDIIHRQGECRVKNLALHMGVSHVTVVRTIARLARESLVVSEPYRPVRLSAKGERLAANSRKRHEIVLSFLLALGVRPVEAARDAGASGAVVCQGTRPVEGLALFEVEDTLPALHRLASRRREDVTGPVVGITGTNGKTATKELLARALGVRWSVHATISTRRHIQVRETSSCLSNWLNRRSRKTAARSCACTPRRAFANTGSSTSTAAC
ncbi:MAG: hypothetical protein IIA33_08795 [Planctomycetes bacterium]|nr:hypothetical protein [Planctomycetota bacterium]